MKFSGGYDDDPNIAKGKVKESFGVAKTGTVSKTERAKPLWQP